MQTFLPYPQYVRTAQVLDNKRLNRQRLDAWLIIKCIRKEMLEDKETHPVVNMWRGSEGSLAMYGIRLCDEWVRRGYKDTLYERFEELVDDYKQAHYLRYNKFGDPPWLGNEDLHASYRATLLKRNPEWYKQFNWKESPSLPFIWPAGSIYNSHHS